MQLNDFDFNLPQELIAQYPCARRSASRLLRLDRETGEIVHQQFSDLPDLLSPKDLLIFNDTRVIPARLYGKKESGGKVEILVERVLDEHRVLAHMRFSKAPRSGARIVLTDQVSAEVVSRQHDLFELFFSGSKNVIDILEDIGHIPLPPYIDRYDEELDRERYQTVFAKRKGAIAAPTAGLHFDADLLEVIKAKKVATAFITLHVGAGTFLPVRVADVKQHKMHAEYIEVTQEVTEEIIATKKRGGRIIAVGTTCVRSLEAAAKDGTVKPYKGDTDIFIYPGYKFNCVDAMITNFHLPKSTLLMLVSAFAGKDNIMNAYNSAIKECYRFFSYGDAMIIL